PRVAVGRALRDPLHRRSEQRPDPPQHRPLGRQSRRRGRPHRRGRGGRVLPAAGTHTRRRSGAQRAGCGAVARGGAMSERPVVLEVEGVTKRFGAVTALYEVSLQLRSGEVLGIIGDNGAGKSTLVGVVSGALKPDEGRIVVDGVERSFTDPAEARAVGIETVFQNLALVPTLNI